MCILSCGFVIGGWAMVSAKAGQLLLLFQLLSGSYFVVWWIRSTLWETVLNRSLELQCEESERKTLIWRRRKWTKASLQALRKHSWSDRGRLSVKHDTLKSPKCQTFHCSSAFLRFFWLRFLICEFKVLARCVFGRALVCCESSFHEYVLTQLHI